MDKTELKKIFTPEQYRVKLFEDMGHERRKCISCGKHFWSIDPDRKVCGDTVCEGGYKFIGREGKNWDFHQTIKKLTDFFKKNGHEVIDRYPVVARWRADLDFTIASIATLQPWVTNGTVDPPANPLVIAQPCLRFGGEFNDLDNIGRTGRHLSSFVMFGQHAFNSERLTTGYWMDKCIDLNFRFLNEELGLKPEEITYVEDIWAGGGNFGPNLESMALGSEIVNSVFMQYALTRDGYKEMDIKVIDVGWGVERVSWFSQGTPTIYEATFGPVFDYMVTKSGIEIDQDLLRRYSVQAGILNIDDVADVKSARSGIAQELGLTLDELNRRLGPVEGLYAIGDHTRTIAFAFADGAIPSNVGGGYNLRVVLRRIFNINELYEFDLDITDLILRQIDYVSKSYPNLKEAKDYVHTLVDLEYRRLQSTIKKGRNYVNRLLKGKKKINEEKLIELYQSHGMPPETVQAIAKEKGIEIDIPQDFYQKVGALQTNNSKEQTEEAPFDLDEVKGLETIQEYYEIPYKYESQGTVLKVLDDLNFVLDKTIIYPIGGGQHEDHATIKIGRSKGRVIDSRKYGKAIVHTLEKPIKGLKEGAKVKIFLDVQRRKTLMRHHSAVHIVGGAARKVLGPHVWQTGTDKSVEKARLDITHWDNLTTEEIEEIERVANEIVVADMEVPKHVMERTEAEKKFGFTIYQGPVIPGRELRIIEIPKFDIEACGGTHVVRTGEVGYIRILGTEKIQDGVIRINLTAGLRAVETVQEQTRWMKEAAETFKVNVDQLPATAKRFWNEWKEQRKKIEKLTKELAEAKIPVAIANAEEVQTSQGSVKLIVLRHDGDQNELIKIAENISVQTSDEGNYIALILGEYQGRALAVVARSKGSTYNLNPIIRGIGRIIGGGGGGKGDVVAGGGSKPENLPEALKKAKEIVSSSI
ncbi:MAG: alanine--tRNA ligase [Methanobacteriota archaeon]|nr:MAG: alanine--tRNA ligase [Euryarchaeota archaeon]